MRRYGSIDEIAKEYALTNEQLLDYLLSNDIDAISDLDKIDLNNKNIMAILDRINRNKKLNNHNNLTSFDIGKGSIGIADAGTGATTINNNSATVALKGDSIYTYTFNTSSNVIGNTAITSTGNGNYGYYVAGNLTNNAGASMNFASGTGNVGIYSAYRTGTGIARNYANIKVGKTDFTS